MTSREKSALYPKASWNDCLEFVRTIAGFHLKTVSYKEVAKKYGVNNTATKSFVARISTCKQFGLITTTGGEAIQLTETAKRLLFPTGEDMRPVELACFAMPPLYNKLIAVYDGKALPSQDILANILMSNHRIQPTVKDAAARFFIESAGQLNLIKGGILCYSDAASDPPASQDAPAESQAGGAEEPPQPAPAPAAPPPAPAAYADGDADYITQSIPFSSGKIARFIIPVDADEDDLLLLRDMFDVLLKRKFKIKTE